MNIQLPGFAYFISAYKEPENIIRLVNVLAKDKDQFYIHYDKKIGRQKFNHWKEIIEQKCRNTCIHVVSKHVCNWGSFGIIDATLSAMKFFEDSNYDYFINLTAECYPIKSLNQINETFKDKNTGFITFWKMPYEGWDHGGMDRINNNYFFLKKKEYPYVKIIHFPRIRKKLPYGLEPYGGWSLCCLPKDIIAYILDYIQNNLRLTSFFKTTRIPSEMIFQTILMNSPLKDRIVNDNKRYLNFVDAHPRTLTKDDYETLKNSKHLFARKFNPSVSKELLDIIDNEIIN